MQLNSKKYEIHLEVVIKTKKKQNFIKSKLQLMRPTISQYC